MRRGEGVSSSSSLNTKTFFLTMDRFLLFAFTNRGNYRDVWQAFFLVSVFLLALS